MGISCSWEIACYIARCCSLFELTKSTNGYSLGRCCLRIYIQVTDVPGPMMFAYRTRIAACGFLATQKTFYHVSAHPIEIVLSRALAFACLPRNFTPPTIRYHGKHLNATLRRKTRLLRSLEIRPVSCGVAWNVSAVRETMASINLKH